ncbi:MAG: glycosyltransferase [Cyanobacteria bacterium P01_E01_bin.35]
METNKIADNITLISNPDKESLINFYNAADILLTPSLYEGFGLTILEAMACGTPTITANVSSLPEVAGDAAILVEPTDVAGITEAVLRISQDANFRQNLIDRGLARVKEFTWKETAIKTVELYEQVVRTKSKVLV